MKKAPFRGFLIYKHESKRYLKKTKLVGPVFTRLHGLYIHPLAVTNVNAPFGEFMGDNPCVWYVPLLAGEINLNTMPNASQVILSVVRHITKIR